MSRRSFRLCLAAVACAVSLTPAGADVKIVLKDGRVIDVPVAPEEVRSIELEQGRTGSSPGLPPPPDMRNAPPAPSFRPGTPGVQDPAPPTPPARSGATFAAPSATADTVHVGPTRAIKLPSQAAQMVKPGDVIEIDAGTYPGDVASWRVDDITLRGVGGKAVLAANGNIAEGKAIWVIKGRNVTVENIEFTGAADRDGNGAGIRGEGADLKIVGCYFHDNQEGILAGNNPDSVIDIENTEFARDGGNGGQSHEIYINHVKELIVRGSYFHEGRIGHLIKSRAFMSVIMANRITDETGSASYEIDFPNGGRLFVIGNLFEKDSSAQNPATIADAMEGATNPEQELWVVNNTFRNDLGRGVFINSRAPTRARIVNNLFIGGGSVFHGLGDLKNNVLAAGPGGAPNLETALFGTGDMTDVGTKTAGDPGVVDLAGYDWHPRSNSVVVGAGADPGDAGGMALLPALRYVHPAHAEAVRIKPPIDVGAYQHAS